MDLAKKSSKTRVQIGPEFQTKIMNVFDIPSPYWLVSSTAALTREPLLTIGWEQALVRLRVAKGWKHANSTPTKGKLGQFYWHERMTELDDIQFCRDMTKVVRVLLASALDVMPDHWTMPTLD